WDAAYPSPGPLEQQPVPEMAEHLAGSPGLIPRKRLRQTDGVPESCSCGAELPPDARFCHKCGKPQRDEIFVEPPAPTAPTPPAPPPVRAVAPSFHNPVAVRVGLFVASIATLLCLTVPIGLVIWLPAAGFISVYLFSRRTGQSLSVLNGARMGWIAGILSFLIITVLFTVIAVALANRPGGLPEFFREQLSSRSIPRQDLENYIDMLANPVNQAVVYLFFLLFWFMVISVFCAAGGAIGAKVLDKD